MDRVDIDADGRTADGQDLASWDSAAWEQIASMKSVSAALDDVLKFEEETAGEKPLSSPVPAPGAAPGDGVPLRVGALPASQALLPGSVPAGSSAHAIAPQTCLPAATVTATDAHDNAAIRGSHESSFSNHCPESSASLPARNADAPQLLKRTRGISATPSLLRASDDSDFEYGNASDPEEARRERRRAKNRRTARASRERKQAEVAALKAQVAANVLELQTLRDIIKAQDARLTALTAASGFPEGLPL